jgi:hypothetical protein
MITLAALALLAAQVPLGNHRIWGRGSEGSLALKEVGHADHADERGNDYQELRASPPMGGPKLLFVVSAFIRVFRVPHLHQGG